MARRDPQVMGASVRPRERTRFMCLVNSHPDLFIQLDSLFGPMRAGAVMVWVDEQMLKPAKRR